MSEIKNGKLGLYCTEHLKRNHKMISGFKRLTKQARKSISQNSLQ